MKKFKARTIQTGIATRIVVQTSNYKGVDGIQFAKQYLDRHSDDWAFARGGFNVPLDQWEKFKKAVNAVKI